LTPKKPRAGASSREAGMLKEEGPCGFTRCLKEAA